MIICVDLMELVSMLKEVSNVIAQLVLPKQTITKPAKISMNVLMKKTASMEDVITFLEDLTATVYLDSKRMKKEWTVSMLMNVKISPIASMVNVSTKAVHMFANVQMDLALTHPVSVA
jgi:hypothetical protein